jgi:hypothetical protein
MKSNIFIPKQINVGFQNRSDTYTKKLAYVIYFDNKGVLRKEASWNSWRDSKINNIIYDNVPTEGFVLNKKVGDYSSGWDHRQAYVRIYDSRDFEFEITIENLLYILENTSAIKGKGLEGEFVYGWDGKDLILIPTSSPDYQEIQKFNDVLFENKKFKVKDLIIGATYKDKSMNEWIYMGRFDKWTRESEMVYKDNNRYSYNYDYIYKDVNKGKHHFFVRETTSWRDEPYLATLMLKSLGDKFIDIVSSDCVENYADLFDRLERTTDFSPYDETKDKYFKYTFDEFKETLDKENYLHFYSSENNEINDKQKIYKKNEWTDDGWKYFDEYTVRNNTTDKYVYENNSQIKEIFDELQPMYKNKYLQNGKLYEREI